MKKNKEERTEEILDLCLNCWKDLSPTQWSLTPVAQACGISKQALYRYFPNKQAILTALKDRYEIKTKTNRSDIYTLAEQHPPQWKAICRLSYEFMYENWDLLLMVMHHGLGDPLETLIELQTFYNNLEKKSSFSKAHWGWFFNGLISFMWQRNPQSYEEMEKFMEKVTKGLAPGVTLSSEVIEQININPLGKIKIEINDNPIDGALLDLMHREGRSDHSMQELAQEAGMGKSSIYNYYCSKEEIFNSVWQKLQLLFQEQWNSMQKDLHGFPQKLYGHILMISRFLQEIPAVRLIMMEMNKNVDMQSLKDETDTKVKFFLPLMLEGVKEGYIDRQSCELTEQLKFISYALGSDMMLDINGTGPEKRALRIFSLFTGGIENHRDDL